MAEQLKQKRIISGEFLLALENLDIYIHKVMNGYFGGNRRSRVYGSSMDFFDYTEYSPGDDPRRIDWSLAARFDRFYIRQYTDEKQLQNVVYLDCSLSMGWDQDRRKEITAKQVAAAMGFLSIQNADRASYHLLKASNCKDLCGSIRSRNAFYMACDALASLCFEGATDLGQAILSDPNPGFENGVSFIISDFLTDSDWRSAADYLMDRKRIVVLVQVLSEEEKEPPWRGKSILHDVEDQEKKKDNGLKLEINRGAVKAYRDAVDYHLNDIKQFCRSRGIACLHINSGDEITRAILYQGYESGLIR